MAADELNHKYSVEGTLSLLCIRRKVALENLAAYSSAFEVTTLADRDLLWFTSAWNAVKAGHEVVMAHSDLCAAGVSTGDTTSEGSIQRLIAEASGSVDLAELGEILVSLSTQEISRSALPDDLTFVNLGARELSTGAKSVLFLLTDRSRHRESFPAGPSVRWNLSEFVGRSDELAQIEDAFRTSRFVILSGPSGIGKSMLAARFSLECQENEFGQILWLDLQEVHRSSLMLHSIAGSLPITFVQEQSLLQQIIKQIAQNDVLIVMDGVDALGDKAVEFAEFVLNQCPNASFLMTSPVRLSSGSATSIELKGLECPSPFERLSEALKYDSVRLIVEICRRDHHGLELNEAESQNLAYIVNAVGGSPMALKIIASRLGVLSTAQILSRLKDDPLGFLVSKDQPRGSAEAALSAAVSTLNRWASRLFQRLWIFEGAFDADALEAICTDGMVPKTSILDSLKDLSEAHLITRSQRGSSRRCFRLNQVSREFSRSRSTSTERKVLPKKLQEFLQEREKRFWSRGLGTDAMALEEFDLRYEDLRKRWVGEIHSLSEAEAIIKSVVNVNNYWFQKNQYAEGYSVFRSIAQDRYAANSPNYASLLNIFAWFAMKTGDYGSAKVLLRSALKLAVGNQSRLDLAKIMNTASAYFVDMDLPRSAARCSRVAVQEIEFANQPEIRRVMRGNLAGCLVAVRHFEEAEGLMTEFSFSESRTTWSDVSILSNFAYLNAERGSWEEAASILREACDVYRTHPYPELLPSLYLTGCTIALGTGRFVDLAILVDAIWSMIDFFGLVPSPKRRRILQEFEEQAGKPHVSFGPGWVSSQPSEILYGFLR